VSALSKRRRHSHYVILPVVITVAFLIVVKLVAMQRAEVIDDLADRVAHRDTADASAAVRQLAGMSRPPIEVLVAAATSGDWRVADEARQAIDKLLRRCGRDVEMGRRTKAVSRQLAELAKTLSSHGEQFSAADYGWLTATAQSILSLANQLPAKHSPDVAILCDTILALAAAENPQDATLVEHTSDTSHSDNAQVSPAPDAERPAQEPIDASWRANWANPVFRELPQTPSDAKPIRNRPIAPVTTAPDEERQPQHAGTIESPLADADSRTLLQRWLTADAANKAALQRHLAKRGFGRLTEPFVRQFASTSAEDRLQFVDDLMSSGVDGRPWLMLLADDPDAEVRLAAVTIMATSNDATLVEKAWQTALHDRDPRIAGLAERLRERRAATQRR
jgi:hypothetical protein